MYIKSGKLIEATDSVIKLKNSNEEVFSLSELEYYLWNSLDGKSHVSNILNHLQNQLDLEHERLRELIVSSMVELLKNKLVKKIS